MTRIIGVSVGARWRAIAHRSVGRWRLPLAMALLGGSCVVDAAPLRHVPQLSAAPLVDGSGDEAVWNEALSLPLDFEVSPQWGVAITATATAKVGTTASGLQVLVTVEQATPIEATAAKHDRGYGDGISVNVQPDPDTLRVFGFDVNAVGATNDDILSSAGAGSPNWNGVWQSAAQQTAHGYSIEVSIPWSTLELGATPTTVIALSIERRLASGRFEQHAFTPIDARQTCIECQYERFRVEPITVAAGEPAFTTRWLPYAIVSEQRTHDPYSGSLVANDSRSDAGVDALFQWRGGRKLLLALNPDFSQVESDAYISTINRRFASTYAERRPFFTEESGAFNTPMALLYTRAIADPQVGIQYVSRRDGATHAALIADDSMTTYLASEQNGSSYVTLPGRSWNVVYRSTTPFVRGQASSWGSFASLRSADGYANGVLAADLNWQTGTQHHWIAQLAGSYARADALAGASASESDFAVTATHLYSRGNFSAYSDYSEIGPGFRADLGSVSRTDTRTLAHSANLTFPQAAGSTLSEASVSAGAYYTDDRHGLLLDGSLSMSAYVSFSNELTLSSSVSRSVSRDESVLIRAQEVSFSASAPLQRYLTLSAGYSRGSSPDYVNSTSGHGRSGSLGLILTGLSRIDGQLFWTRSDFRSDLPGAESTLEFAMLRVNLHPGAHHHVSLFANPFRSSDRLDPTLAIREPDAFLQWQITYTYEHSRFTRLIVGASRSEQGGADIDGLQPRGELMFAKWVLEL